MLLPLIFDGRGLFFTSCRGRLTGNEVNNHSWPLLQNFIGMVVNLIIVALLFLLTKNNKLCYAGQSLSWLSQSSQPSLDLAASPRAQPVLQKFCFIFLLYCLSYPFSWAEEHWNKDIRDNCSRHLFLCREMPAFYLA